MKQRELTIIFIVKFTYVDKDIYVVVQQEYNPFLVDLPMIQIIDYVDAKIIENT